MKYAHVPRFALSAVTLAKRWRVGLDISNLKARFYRCDVRKADNASLNCVTASVPDATLAIGTQGNARLWRFGSNYPVALSSHLKIQRFWAEHSGTVFRGVRDLPNTRNDQRLNAVAWDALRSALGIPAHTAAVTPAQAGPFETLRSFTFTDLAKYTWRIFKGDSSVVDGAGQYLASEERGSYSGGASIPFVRGQLMWTGTEWYDGPSKDGTFDYGGWGLNPNANPALASTFFLPAAPWNTGATCAKQRPSTWAPPWTTRCARHPLRTPPQRLTPGPARQRWMTSSPNTRVIGRAAA